MAEFTLREADAVLTQALELADDARKSLLDERCGLGTAMRALVEQLLRAAESPDEGLIAPGGGASGPLWEELACRFSGTALLGDGDRLGAYRIVRRIGRGGMATVFLAERADGQFKQAVALKVLDAGRDFDDLAARFAQERQILATLNHPHIARLIDGGITERGWPYVVMEYVDGEPIDAYCDRCKLLVEQRIALFEHVASAVQYAHEHLIVHRDIKPSNILVTADSLPKLLDFGIAKLLDRSASHAAPETRSLLHPMTPEYASPEQVHGRPLTAASDVYQLGYLLYQLLTGQAPYRFDRQNVAEVVQTICGKEPAPPSQVVKTLRLRRKLAGDLDRIVLKALSKEPERRYASVHEFREDLRRQSQGLPIRARPPTLRYRADRFLRRHRFGVAAAALVVLALLGGLATTVWQASVAVREARRSVEVRDFLVGLFESTQPDATLGRTVTAKELLDRGAAALAVRLSAEPEIRAEMLGIVGNIYRQLGLYAEARPLLEEALELRRKLGASNSGAVATSAGDLALVLHEQGQYPEAESLAREAVALRRGGIFKEPSEFSASLAVLASILSRRGENDEARDLYRASIEADRSSGDRQALAAHLADFAIALWRESLNEQAQSAVAEALALQRELYGATHTRVAATLVSQAQILTELGDYADAEQSADEALQMRQQLFGDDHPHTAEALVELGNVLQRAGRLDEAEVVQRRALEIYRAVFGDDHPEVAEALNYLGVTFYYKSQMPEAAALFQRSLDIWRHAYGPLHRDVLLVMNNLGSALRQAGDYEKAEIVLRETLALRRQVFGNEHRDVGQSYNNLAIVLARRGNKVEAEAAYREGVAIARRTMGDRHPDVGDFLASLGKFLLDERRFEDAEPVLRESLEVRALTQDPEAPLLAASRLNLGECLLRLDRHAEAVSLLAASVPVLARRWGEEDEITVRARRAYAQAQASKSEANPP